MHKEDYENIIKFYQNDHDILDLLSIKLNTINQYVLRVTENQIKLLKSNKRQKQIAFENDIWFDILHDAVALLNNLYCKAGYVFYEGDLKDKKSLSEFAKNFVLEFFEKSQVFK